MDNTGNLLADVAKQELADVAKQELADVAKQFQCLECNKSYKFASGLSKHKKKKHGNVNSHVSGGGAGGAAVAGTDGAAAAAYDDEEDGIYNKTMAENAARMKIRNEYMEKELQKIKQMQVEMDENVAKGKNISRDKHMHAMYAASVIVKTVEDIEAVAVANGLAILEPNIVEEKTALVAPALSAGNGEVLNVISSDKYESHDDADLNERQRRAIAMMLTENTVLRHFIVDQSYIIRSFRDIICGLYKHISEIEDNYNIEIYYNIIRDEKNNKSDTVMDKFIMGGKSVDTNLFKNNGQKHFNGGGGLKNAISDAFQTASVLSGGAQNQTSGLKTQKLSSSSASDEDDDVINENDDMSDADAALASLKNSIKTSIASNDFETAKHMQEMYDRVKINIKRNLQRIEENKNLAKENANSNTKN
jgi:hypothetical protein